MHSWVRTNHVTNFFEENVYERQDWNHHRTFDNAVSKILSPIVDMATEKHTHKKVHTDE